MSKQGKLVAGIIAALFLICTVTAVIIHVLPKTDENGWIHNESVSSVDEDENKSRSYALVNAVKEEWEGIDSHTYIKKITSVLDAYQGKTHTTFVFSDGTGIMYPGSRITETGFYGKLNADGTMNLIYGYIHYKENEITYQEVSSFMSEETNILKDCIDDRLKNDSFYVNKDDGMIYVVVTAAENETTLAEELLLDVNNSGVSYTGIHMMINNRPYEVINGVLSEAEYSVTFIK